MKGLEKFRERFGAHSDKYVLIGGTASYLVLDEAGLQPRATKDLDIVLCLEVLDAGFVKEFWQFVADGGYQSQQQSTGKRTFYRFSKPTDPEYPAMLELFSRRPEQLPVIEGCVLTPIPVDEEVSSLSAILLDDEYYSFIQEHRSELNGLSIVTEKCLIPLKALAWLELTGRKDKGDQVDSRNITKHQNDVIRLSGLLSPENPIKVPPRIHADLTRYLDILETKDIDLKPFGLNGIHIKEVVAGLRQYFQPISS